MKKRSKSGKVILNIAYVILWYFVFILSISIMHMIGDDGFVGMLLADAVFITLLVIVHKKRTNISTAAKNPKYKIVDEEAPSKTGTPVYRAAPHYPILKNSYIDEKLRLLQNKLGISVFNECEFDDDVIKNLKTYLKTAPTANDNAVKEVVKRILLHIGMIPEWVDIKVKYEKAAATDGESRTGIYRETGFLQGEIGILIEPKYGVNEVIAIACHECAHHFLNKRKIRLEYTAENEKLTDIATAYLGFGEYMVRGYKTRESYIDHGKAKRTSKLGYLSDDEVRYLNTKVLGLQFVEEQKQADLLELKRRIDKKLSVLESEAQANQKAFSAVTENLDFAYNSNGYLKLIEENFRVIQCGEVSVWSAGIRKKMQSSNAQTQYRGLQNEIEECRERINEFNRAIEKYLVLAQYQAAFDVEAINQLKNLHAEAAKKNGKATIELIKFYLSVPGFEYEATWYFDNLCEIQDAESLCALGDCCRKGLIAARDDEKAKYYYFNAMQLGSEEAGEKMKDFYQFLHTST